MPTLRHTLLLLAALSTAASASAEDGWVALFDGKTLDGWTQRNGTATYEVVDGTIKGTTKEGSPNSFLCTDKDYANFEIEFDVKVDDALNSGCQIRSTTTPVHVEGADPKKGPKGDRLNGPQCEIEASPGQAGYIYGEATGLGWLSPEPNSKDPAVNQHSLMKNGDWNHFRIVANGATIKSYINGTEVADLTNEAIFKSHPKGTIGLQVHGIKPGTGPYSVQWKDIRIKELP
ncbi:MAG: DUF1080 domain-containing protein [Verrucomicrobiales bacterium]|nr:DUF1080 domain-containing protein [Verrucomicrobiales bacterium]